MSLKQENKHKVFVSIVSYNGEDLIETCLKSVFNSSIPVHVFVVDNNSNDNTIELIEKHFPQVELIKSSVNLGFGRANNIVFKRFSEEEGDYVFLLNQDATVEVNTIEQLIKSFNKLPDAGIISPLHKANALELDYGFSKYLKSTKSGDMISDILFSKIKNNYEVLFVNAAAWLLSKKTVEKIGGFNPLFFMYGEDVNYCQRVIFNQLKIFVNTRVAIYHSRVNSETKKRVEDYSRIDSYKVQIRKQLILVMSPDHSLYDGLVKDISSRFTRIAYNLLTNKGKGSLADIKVILRTPFIVYKYSKYKKRQNKGFLSNE